jgi:hypothetical protein
VVAGARFPQQLPANRRLPGATLADGLALVTALESGCGHSGLYVNALGFGPRLLLTAYSRSVAPAVVAAPSIPAIGGAQPMLLLEPDNFLARSLNKASGSAFVDSVTCRRLLPAARADTRRLLLPLLTAMSGWRLRWERNALWRWKAAVSDQSVPEPEPAPIGRMHPLRFAWICWRQQLKRRRSMKEFARVFVDAWRRKMLRDAWDRFLSRLPPPLIGWDEAWLSMYHLGRKRLALMRWKANHRVFRGARLLDRLLRRRMLRRGWDEWVAKLRAWQRAEKLLRIRYSLVMWRYWLRWNRAEALARANHRTHMLEQFVRVWRLHTGHKLFQRALLRRAWSRLCASPETVPVEPEVVVAPPAPHRHDLVCACIEVPHAIDVPRHIRDEEMARRERNRRHWVRHREDPMQQSAPARCMTASTRLRQSILSAPENKAVLAKSEAPRSATCATADPSPASSPVKGRRAATGGSMGAMSKTATVDTAWTDEEKEPRRRKPGQLATRNDRFCRPQAHLLRRLEGLVSEAKAAGADWSESSTVSVKPVLWKTVRDSGSSEGSASTFSDLRAWVAAERRSLGDAGASSAQGRGVLSSGGGAVQVRLAPPPRIVGQGTGAHHKSGLSSTTAWFVS